MTFLLIPHPHTQDDMMNVLKTIKAEGGNGVILWGSSSQFKTEAQCRTFQSYFTGNLVPLLNDVKKTKLIN